MRIKAVQIAWFRGAADPVSLQPECKSMVVYGVNASGKSSFVDAIEYFLNDGKIGHLSHEYSGKHLKNALPNTLKPRGAKVELRVTFCDDSEAKVEIKEDGSTIPSGSMVSKVGAWDYRRTVLRQEEVVEFIRETKGEKYSALLPLFGLHEMELAAENLRQVAKNVESLSQVELQKEQLRQTQSLRKATFGVSTDDQILEKIKALHRKHCAGKPTSKDGLSCCADIAAALNQRLAQLNPDQKRYTTLRTAAELPIKKHVDAVRAASVTMAGAVDPLIAQKIAVLQPTETFIGKLARDGEVECPACGRLIKTVEFREHINAELRRLHAIRQTFNERNNAMASLCDASKSLQANLGRPDIKTWREGLATGGLAKCLAYLNGFNAEALRAVCADADLRLIEENLLPLVEAAVAATTDGPPDVQQLLEEQRMVDTAKAVLAAAEKSAVVGRAEALLLVLNFAEQATRDEIRLRSNAVIDEISDDIKRMWEILHPGEAIENVHLYLPKGTDKAIDIGLKFHGKELESPRLTLSEGYRNSLGLCIFLAMAKREAHNDRPVILDDVVLSLDRNHRGMIVELLAKEFATRQVVILTHDRDWYTELRQQLDDTTWNFKSLLPYENPSIGIRWSHKTGTFDDARSQLKERPDSAGNDARKIMDVELALAAERLKIKFPYLRFDKNDRRTAHEFLERLVADGARCLQRRVGKDYGCYEEALKAFNIADQLLGSWGNRASHSFDIVRPEAEKLIDACETALGCLKCSSCGKAAWFANAAGSEWVQCQCSDLRWRYGKN